MRACKHHKNSWFGILNEVLITPKIVSNVAVSFIFDSILPVTKSLLGVELTIIINYFSRVKCAKVPQPVLPVDSCTKMYSENCLFPTNVCASQVFNVVFISLAIQQSIV